MVPIREGLQGNKEKTLERGSWEFPLSEKGNTEGPAGRRLSPGTVPKGREQLGRKRFLMQAWEKRNSREDAWEGIGRKP